MFPTLVRRLAQVTKPRLNAVGTNPTYKLKKVWPPDIKNMTSQQQLRFEKKYKRRLKLATARPRWDKFVRVAQLCTMTAVLTYIVLFMDWEGGPTPFDPLRERLFDFFGVFNEENRKPKMKDRPVPQPATKQ